jgi:membrane protein DedA with SNARE-associated domain
VEKMKIDRFTKYALLTMFAIVAVLTVCTYVGYSVFGSSIFETKYLTVIEDQAKQLGLVFGHVIELGETGEYVGFTLAGVIAGFVIGYLIPLVFYQKEGD